MLTCEEVVTITLKVISATIKMILATDEVLTATLKVISATTNRNTNLKLSCAFVNNQTQHILHPCDGMCQ